jgi:hypothetical protein
MAKKPNKAGPHAPSSDVPATPELGNEPSADESKAPSSEALAASDLGNEPSSTDASESVDPSASDTAPPNQSPEEAAPLFAVTMAKVGGKYFEPGMQIEADRIAKAGPATIADLLNAGAIRKG